VKVHSTKEAARLLGVHHGTIFNNIRRGMPAPPITRTVRRKQKGRTLFNRGGLPQRVWTAENIKNARSWIREQDHARRAKLTRETVCRLCHVSRETADAWARANLDYDPSDSGWNPADVTRLKRHAACRLRTTTAVCRELRIDGGTLRRWEREGFVTPSLVSHPGRARARLWSSKDVARLKDFMRRRYRTKYWLQPHRGWAPGTAHARRI
jgi:hypothetical protein